MLQTQLKYNQWHRALKHILPMIEYIGTNLFLLLKLEKIQPLAYFHSYTQVYTNIKILLRTFVLPMIQYNRLLIG